VLNLMPPPPERKSRLASDIEQSARKDCRDAYAGLGVLAPLGAALDAARDRACKW
jgi:Meckel syndrome type 1 protein